FNPNLGGEVRLVVPRQQVTGEAEPQHHKKEQDADHPVELPGVFVGTGEEDAQGVEEQHDDRHAGAPVVHPPDDLAEGHFVLQVFHAGVGVNDVRNVVHGQKHPGQNLNHHDEKGQTAETINERGKIVGRVDVLGHLVVGQ